MLEEARMWDQGERTTGCRWDRTVEADWAGRI